MSDVRPFLSTIPGALKNAPKSLGSALGSVHTEPVTSWLPRSNEKPAIAAPQIDTTEIEYQAREQARAEGLAETEELRAQLKSAIAAFTTARAEIVEPNADKVALAAAAVVSAWTQTAPQKDLYAPVIAAWIENASGPATVCVPPAAVATMKELVENTDIKVTADSSMKNGDVRISSATRELAHSWDAKLIELREAIANALENQ